MALKPEEYVELTCYRCSNYGMCKGELNCFMRDAVEKIIVPKEVTHIDMSVKLVDEMPENIGTLCVCSCCGMQLNKDLKQLHCHGCGQLLNWEE